jgi:hypothetical protein
MASNESIRVGLIKRDYRRNEMSHQEKAALAG